MKIKIVLLTAFMAVAGCNSASSMPEVNDENCKLDNIKQMEDNPMRKEFAGRCARESPDTIAPTKNPKNWLEY